MASEFSWGNHAFSSTTPTRSQKERSPSKRRRRDPPAQKSRAHPPTTETSQQQRSKHTNLPNNAESGDVEAPVLPETTISIPKPPTEATEESELLGELKADPGHRPNAKRLKRLLHKIPELEKQPEVALNLIAHGIFSDASYFNTDSSKLYQLGLSLADERKIRKKLLSRSTACPISGTDLLRRFQKTTRILPTGLPGLDEILDGGLFTGEVVEFIGMPASGKSQICMHLAQQVANESGKVVYIDTGGAFSVTRIKSFAIQQGFGEDLEKTLESIVYLRVHTAQELLRTLESLVSRTLRVADAGADVTDVRLVIVDSFAAIISPLLSRAHTRGHAMMVYAGRLLHKLAHGQSLAVVVTNYGSNTDYNSTDTTQRAALGAAWLHVPHMRWSCVQQDADKAYTERDITILKSNRIPIGGSTKIKISGHGLEQVTAHHFQTDSGLFCFEMST